MRSRYRIRGSIDSLLGTTTVLRIRGVKSGEDGAVSQDQLKREDFERIWATEIILAAL